MKNIFGEEVVRKVTLDRYVCEKALYGAFPHPMTPEGLVSYLYTPYEAVIDFQLLCAGKNAGQMISLLFNPHRLDIRTKKSVSLVHAFNHKKTFLSGLARLSIFRITNDVCSTRDLLYRAMEFGINGIQLANEFPPHVARDHYISFNASRVLDPCAGWGGRMLGAASVGAYYQAYEPSTATYDGLCKMGDWLGRFETGFNYKIINKPFEDADVPNGFDIAYTSPPYYDTERYSEEDTNSCNRYKDFESWLDGFYVPMVKKCLAATKKGFVINIGCRKYDLISPLKQFNLREIRSKLGGQGASMGKKVDGRERFFIVTKKA